MPRVDPRQSLDELTDRERSKQLAFLARGYVDHMRRLDEERNQPPVPPRPPKPFNPRDSASLRAQAATAEEVVNKKARLSGGLAATIGISLLIAVIGLAISSLMVGFGAALTATAPYWTLSSVVLMAATGAGIWRNKVEKTIKAAKERVRGLRTRANDLGLGPQENLLTSAALEPVKRDEAWGHQMALWRQGLEAREWVAGNYLSTFTNCLREGLEDGGFDPEMENFLVGLRMEGVANPEAIARRLATEGEFERQAKRARSIDDGTLGVVLASTSGDAYIGGDGGGGGGDGGCD